MELTYKEFRSVFGDGAKDRLGASGFTIPQEEQRVLELGLPPVQFTIQTPETQVIFLITALRDQYLVLSGEGNLELANEIVGRLRPIS